MELATNVVLICACVLIAWGSFGLIATWLVPALKKSRLLSRKMFIGRIDPTRMNLTLISLWGIVFGVFLLASALQYRRLFWASFVIFIPLAIWRIVRSSKPGREA
ncbi:hypothetical protein [Luteimonas terricola]|uniref:Uncharacterized protein n=1 Tax=Luteimonas terricola TaxID=645597 RepID=A0ABQ2EN38_9GAMM|nr:hypothetical protein [Luteimonas terricola]GGK17209.1 hypothetical protein GCM10011394_28000 [Luteimonas terricola]